MYCELNVGQVAILVVELVVELVLEPGVREHEHDLQYGVEVA